MRLNFRGASVTGMFLATCSTLAVVGSPFFAFIALKSLDPSWVDEGSWYVRAESRPFLMLTRTAVLSAASLFGVLGATLSVLTRTRATQVGAQQLFVLQLVGATFALILSLIFAGGFIQGSLFPGGPPSSYSWFGVIYLHGEFAKLLVWSFIAGFSERTMPDILRKLAERLSGEVEFQQVRKEKEKGEQAEN